MPGCGHELRVHRLVGEHQEEGRVGIGTLAAQPVERLAGEHVGGVAGHRVARAVHVQDRVLVDALAAEAHPVIEAGTRVVHVLAHVPFPDVGRAPAGLLQQCREEHRPLRDARCVVHHAVPVRVLAGQDRGPARRAQRRGHERVRQVRALRSHAVQAGRLQERRRALHEAHEVVAVIIAQDDDHVTRLRRALGAGTRGRAQQQRGEQDRAGAQPRPASLPGSRRSPCDVVRPHGTTSNFADCVAAELPPTNTVNQPGSTTGVRSGP